MKCLLIIVVVRLTFFFFKKGKTSCDGVVTSIAYYYWQFPWRWFLVLNLSFPEVLDT